MKKLDRYVIKSLHLASHIFRILSLAPINTDILAQYIDDKSIYQKSC